MAKKKQAGLERPYTMQEFADKIEAIAKEQKVPYLEHLDYICCGIVKEREITNPYADLTMKVSFGGNEGIYADIYLRTEGKTEDFFTCKTLGESDEDFVAISAMAAHLCCIGKHYIADHMDEFTWQGHEVNFYDGDRLCGGYALIPKEDIDEVAMRGINEGLRVEIRDNVARETWEYKPKKS